MRQAHMAEVTYVCDVVGCDESRRVNETYGLPFRWLRITIEQRDHHFCERHAHDVREVITFGKRQVAPKRQKVWLTIEHRAGSDDLKVWATADSALAYAQAHDPCSVIRQDVK